MGSKDYLKQRGHRWYVQVSIPAHLRKAAGGKSEYIKSLGTSDLATANRLKHGYVHTFKQQIAALGRKRGVGEKQAEINELYEKALAWREVFERHKGEILFEDQEGNPYYANDEFLSQLSEEAEEYLETHSKAAVDAFYGIAKGEWTPLSAQIEPWLAQEAPRVTGQTISQHRSVLTAFLNWAGDAVTVEEVTRRRAGEYVDYLLSPASKVSRRTAQRHVSSLSSLWKRLEARGLATANPWLNQGVGKRSKRGGATGRKQWSDEALIKVLTGKYTLRYTQTLHDLVKLALVTGARLDELCALKPEHVQHRADGWWISIPEGKTAAAVRDIPVHDSVASLLERRKRHARSYLFDGLVPGGPDQKRSWNVSKAFGHYTTKLELGKDRQVFHALRNTFTEAMEGAEVPESTVKLIIGHARGSLTYGLYSKGQRVQLRDAINKLRYSSRLMKLIREPTEIRGDKSHPTGHRRAVKQQRPLENT